MLVDMGYFLVLEFRVVFGARGNRLGNIIGQSQRLISRDTYIREDNYRLYN